MYKKRVVIESTLHKELKLIAVENDIDLQDIIHMALDLFLEKCKENEIDFSGGDDE